MLRTNRVLQITFWLFSLACTRALLAEPAEEVPDYGRGAIRWSIGWTSPDGKQVAEGLYLFDMAPVGTVARLLAETPSGKRVLLTQTLDAGRGSFTTDLVDDTSGWWARVVKDVGLPSKSLGAFFAAAKRELVPEKNQTLGLRFLTSDGFLFERKSLSVFPEEEQSKVFVELMSDAKATRQLAESIPEDLVEALFFLEESMSPSPLPLYHENDNLAFGLRRVVEILTGTLRTTASTKLPLPEAADPWPMTVGPLEKGVSLVDPKQLEFVSRFRSIENANPLADHRVEEVLAPVAEPQL